MPCELLSDLGCALVVLRVNWVSELPVPLPLIYSLILIQVPAA